MPLLFDESAVNQFLLKSAMRSDLSDKVVHDNFIMDTASHTFTIIKDDGLYKHLRYATPGDSLYAMSIVTWPGYLSVSGDVGDYMFSHEVDMIGLFRRTSSVKYWMEKCVSLDKDAGLTTYDPREAVAFVIDYVNELDDEKKLSIHDREKIQSKLISLLTELMTSSSSSEALHHIMSFNYEFEDGSEFNFLDSGLESNFTVPAYHFKYVLHGIAKVIALYDELTLKKLPSEGVIYGKSASPKRKASL